MGLYWPVSPPSLSDRRRANDCDNWDAIALENQDIELKLMVKYGCFLSLILCVNLYLYLFGFD